MALKAVPFRKSVFVVTYDLKAVPSGKAAFSATC
jgi:hypothetical protein